ncbi:MAG: LytT family sensor histidine kinase [Chitinophagaceae bacterium]|nr:LytT family sensor histidine kinase [Chitinophagaceae bacterium]
MRHPLLYKRNHLYHYLLDSLILTVLHSALLYRLCDLPLAISITDAMVYNSLFAVLGFFSWYTVRFLSMDLASPKLSLLSLFNQTATALLFISGWLFSGYFILYHLHLSASYDQFLKAALPWRFVEGLFLYSIVALAYYLYKYYYSYKERITYEAQWNAAIKERELALLKSQLQPHFIFNALNSIHSLMLSDAKGAEEMLTKLAAFLRLSIHQAEEKTVSLTEELENSALYSDIEKIRFRDRLMIQTHVEEGLEQTQVPHLILQPLIENAIRHGLHQTIEAVTVTIDAQKTEKGIEIFISNNHDVKEKKQAGSGTGLLHVRRRMTLLYGRKDLVKVKDENGIFEVRLLIPQY